MPSWQLRILDFSPRSGKDNAVTRFWTKGGHGTRGFYQGGPDGQNAVD